MSAEMPQVGAVVIIRCSNGFSGPAIWNGSYWEADREAGVTNILGWKPTGATP